MPNAVLYTTREPVRGNMKTISAPYKNYFCTSASVPPGSTGSGTGRRAKSRRTDARMCSDNFWPSANFNSKTDVSTFSSCCSDRRMNYCFAFNFLFASNATTAECMAIGNCNSRCNTVRRLGHDAMIIRMSGSNPQNIRMSGSKTQNVRTSGANATPMLLAFVAPAAALC